MKKLGIIGGLGPMATAYFMQLLIEMTQASTDQQHMEMIICNKPSIPDRTKYILGLSDQDPLPEILGCGEFLRKAGAEYIAIPCITAHFFHEELCEGIGLPVVHAIKEVAEYVKVRNVKCVGIMATDGTVQSKLFQNHLKEQGITCVEPSAHKQKMVMDLIYRDVKAGHRANMKEFMLVYEELIEGGAQVIILGCTELSMIKRDEKLPPGVLDAMEILSKVTVEKCATLKDKYIELITK